MVPDPLLTNVDLFGVWHITLFWGLTLILLALIWKQPKWIPWEGKALWAWVLGSALLTLEFPSLSYGPNHTAFMATAGQTFAEALLIPLAAIYFPEKLRRVLPWLVALELWAVFFADQSRGLLHQGSFDLALLALCLPFVYWGLGALIVLAVVTHHGGTALGILGAEAAVFAWYRYRWALLALPILAGLAIWHSHGPLLDGGERLRAWATFCKLWLSSWEQALFGVGAGSFMWSSLIATRFAAPRFLSAHNDWLQVGYEYGLLGLGLAMLLFYRVWRTTSGDYKRRGAVAGCAVFALTYHPLRFFPSAVIVALIFRDALVNQVDVKLARRRAQSTQGEDTDAHWGGLLNWHGVHVSSKVGASGHQELGDFRTAGAADFSNADLQRRGSGV